MDWKALHRDINTFAADLGLEVEVTDTTYLGGQVTTYRLNEGSQVFYELKHTKPINERGSKLRLYSPFAGAESIKVKSRLIGRTSIKSERELSAELREDLLALAEKIGSFSWIAETHHSGWPTKLSQTPVLTFECKQISEAASALSDIRKIQLQLLQQVK